MSVNDEMIQPSSDSFWEVDCYKRTVKRHEDGYKLCTDLMQLIQDRAEIEKHYAKSLRGWSKKWHELIEKGPEYGTTQAAWKGVLTESERVADLHIDVKDSLLNDVQSSIKQWRGDNYTKPMMGHCKQTKELEDGFRKAQKPWAKRYGKVMKCRKDYHTACKLEKTATHQENNARGDTGVSADQAQFSKLKKLQEKAEKCRRDVENTKDKYEAALNDINSYNAKYMEDMTEVFHKSQDWEEKRLKFFKEMLFGIQKCLDLSVNPEYGNIYQQLHSTISIADYTKDLKHWSNFHGVDMPMNWPNFEEYSPDLHSISKKKNHGVEGITLTSIQRSNNAPPQSYNNYSMANDNTQHAPPETQVSNTSRFSAMYDNRLNPFGDDEDALSDTPRTPSSAGSFRNRANNEPEEDAYDAYEESEKASKTNAVRVRALYDYVGQEDDELSFKAGDTFDKLEDEDEQGWCKGEKDGHIGLYPKNYCEPC